MAAPTRRRGVEEVEEIERLDEGCRSPAEQQQLDAHYAKQQRQHVDTSFERFLKNGGVHFPGIDGDALTETSDVMEQIRQTFSRWK